MARPFPVESREQVCKLTSFYDLAVRCGTGRLCQSGGATLPAITVVRVATVSAVLTVACIPTASITVVAATPICKDGEEAAPWVFFYVRKTNKKTEQTICM